MSPSSYRCSTPHDHSTLAGSKTELSDFRRKTRPTARAATAVRLSAPTADVRQAAADPSPAGPSRASGATRELRGKRSGRIPGRAVSAPAEEPEPRDPRPGVAQLPGEARHHDRALAVDDPGVVARLVQRARLVGDPSGGREVAPEHGGVLTLLEDREDGVARCAVLALTAEQPPQQRGGLAGGHEVLPAARGRIEVVHLACEATPRTPPLTQPLVHPIRADTLDEPVRRGVVGDDDRERREITQRQRADLPQVAQHPAPVDALTYLDTLLEVQQTLRGIGMDGHYERELDRRRRREELVRALREELVPVGAARERGRFAGKGGERGASRREPLVHRPRG